MATEDGTWAYRDRFHREFGRAYFRRLGEGVVSSVGLGTYLGDPTDAVDEAYGEAVRAALDGGCNVVDTAINYRHQRSERVVGRAVADSDVDREAVFVSTKGGFVPFEGERPDDPGAYVREEYVDTGIVDPPDLVRGSHCIAPDFVEDQLDRSLENLGFDAVDCYYVHNPETQLEEHSRSAVYDQLEATFERLEARAAAGDLRHYGLATWDAFRVPSDDPSYLSLSAVISRARAAARSAGNPATHFRAVQLPFNVLMADAFTVEAQESAEGPQSVLRFARESGLNVFTSASLAQGRLAEGLPEAVADQLAGETPVQRAVNFARSAPGVTCSLVGMRSSEHVEEVLAAGRTDAMGSDAFDAVFE